MTAPRREGLLETRAAIGTLRGLLHERASVADPAPEAACAAVDVRAAIIVLTISAAAGIALAIASSHYPRALLAVMVGGSIVNLVSFALGSRWKKLVVEPPARDRSPHEVLKNESASFRAWFSRHNFVYTSLGVLVTIVVWDRFGPSKPTLTFMAACLACSVAAFLGAMVGVRARLLAVCWRAPCPTALPTLDVRRWLRQAGSVLILRGRADYAFQLDWVTTGGRQYSDALVIHASRTHAGRSVTRRFFDEAALGAGVAALDRRERVSRALVLAPFFVAVLLAAWLPVVQFAGNWPLPPLSRIFRIASSNSGSADSQRQQGPGSSADNREPSKTKPGDNSAAGQQARSERAAPGDAASSGGTPAGSPDGAHADQANSTDQARGAGDSPSGENQKADSGSPGSQGGGAGDRSSQAGGDSKEGAGAKNGAPAQGSQASTTTGGAGNESGGQGSGAGQARGRVGSQSGGNGQSGSASSGSPGNGNTPSKSTGAGNDASSDSGRGGEAGSGAGGHGHGSSGDEPQRASTPTEPPPLPRNPGAVIEVPLPPFAYEAQPDGNDDAASAKPAVSQVADRRDPKYVPREPGKGPGEVRRPQEPTQRWPNWVFRLLHR